MSKHNHYFKDVSHLERVDVYRVVELFEVPAGALDHAAKKILCAGYRGHKDLERDVQDIIDGLQRWQEMREEDRRAEVVVVTAPLWTEAEEARQEVVNQNGNDGEHYAAPTATMFR